MNEDRDTELIDADELRLALHSMRPNRELFAAGVERHMALRTSEPLQAETVIESHGSSSRWLQTAAAVIPLPLFGKASGVGLVKFSQLSLFQKTVAIAALPATTILLMLAGTLWAVIKIRQAHRNQTSDQLDAIKLSTVSLAWWRQYALVMFALSIVIVLLTFTGYALPVLLFFALSGVAMVSLIVTLGRWQLIDRRTLAGFLAPSMLNLMQLSLAFSFLNRGFPFLDQTLIPAVLAFGVAFITIVFNPNGLQNRVLNLVIGLGLVWLGGWFAYSYLNPITQRDLARYVESFDYARFSSASWRQWSVPAKWLRDSKIAVDWSKPRALLEKELAQDKPNVHILLSAFSAGLMEPADVDRVRQLPGWRGTVVSRDNATQPFVSLDGIYELVIRASVVRGELANAERDYLSGRLLATLEARKVKHNGRLLEELLTITEIAALIDRPLDKAAHRDFVQQSIISHQVLTGRWAGGFRSYDRLDASDEEATLAAIELMEQYGLPSEVRVDALRSYLRPRFEEHGSTLRGNACVREVSLRRMNALPGVPPISLSDFLNHEQPLLISLLFTFVCIFAIWGAPNLKPS